MLLGFAVIVQEEKFNLGQCQRPLFMVLGLVAVEVAAHLMELESRENWAMCQGLDSSFPRAQLK